MYYIVSVFNKMKVLMDDLRLDRSELIVPINEKAVMDESLDAAFEPNSVAVIGASNDPNKLGGSEIKLLLDAKFKGEIYPINPKEDVIQGLKAYASVLDVPETIDRATIILPPKLVPQAVKECAEKKVKVVQIYSAGFSEFGEEGIKLEEQMLNDAKKHNMKIIGPNCIGTYSPSGRITFVKGTTMELGQVAFVSQSGGITFDIVNRGELSGIKFSKAISIGNAIDLDHADYLEYLNNDKSTKIIGLYIESVRDGQKFFQTLKKVAAHKPVVILKGGRTESGTHSVASHTGSIAGDYRIWQTLFKQTGIYQVKSVEEMITALLCLQNLERRPKGKVALLGNGGGATVLATDLLAELNISLASISSSTSKQFATMGVSNDNRNINPIDLPAHELIVEDGKRFGTLMELLAKENDVDYVLFHINLVPFASYFNLEDVLEKITNQLLRIHHLGANIIGAFRTNGDPELERIRYLAVKVLAEHQIPVFRSVEEAAFGISVLSGEI